MIADKHDASIAAVATRYVLQKRQVGAAIVGTRHARHLPDTVRLFHFDLDHEDQAAIERVADRAPGLQGDVYALERVKGGKHASIMKYNLNVDRTATALEE
jgi:diketogulonate reductase-like aldo/keto reductase